MNEVSVKLQGGLGNYMFQIACANAYALRNDKTTIFTTDDSMVAHKNINSYKDNILNNVDMIPRHDLSTYKQQQELVFNYIQIPNFNHNVYLNGYFQSEKYFNDFEKETRDLFSYSIEVDKETQNLLDNENTCSIHIRRGDYLKSPNHHPTQDMNYYMKAIKKMPKNSVFLIFSDDIEWCKSNFPDVPEKFKFIEGNKDYEDLYIMSQCNNNIICNSTFSWWGAWLNGNKEKEVVMPSKWFGPALATHDTKDLCCEGWIKI
jgi:hypothetical protein